MTDAMTSRASLPTGRGVATLGSHGTDDGQLSNTGGVDVDASGAPSSTRTMTTTASRHGIRTGDYLWSHATGTMGGPSSLPLDVAAAADGNLYVSTAPGIHVLGSDRSPLTAWTPPDVEGADTPYTLAVAADGSVYVASLVHDLIFELTDQRAAG